MSDEKSNPLKAAKDKRVRKLSKFLDFHPKEKRGHSIEDVVDFASSDKITLQELKDGTEKAGFKVRIIISPIIQ